MNRDPFYREIKERLSERLDHELFEQCAADLLRRVYPTLVPIRGGGDAGMDGAIADEGGPPIPLVTTTAKDVKRNLKRNLESYIESGGERRAVVVATARVLNKRARDGLEEVAEELGFTLRQIHDGASFADLLYRAPHWCEELLGLTGTPPSLSLLPLPTRPLLGENLVGREEDLRWLEENDGDLLLIGQPGSGKTFLLHVFAKRGGGLFVHTSDLTEVAAGIRAQEPSGLIIDDAHVQVDLIPQLKRLREEMGAEFRIIANSWLGGRPEVAKALVIPSERIRELQLLSKDEIAEIVKESGIGGPRRLVQEIVNQAEGRPGLAVTLCHLCLRGDVRALARGDALADEIATTFERLLEDDVVPFLAAFSVGGDSGMAMDDVARCLEIPILELRKRTSKLAAGGVLLEVAGRLAVRPPALRHALLRRVFFGGSTSLPIDPLIAIAPNHNALTETLVGAQARGAEIPEGLARSLLERCDSRTAWVGYASLGRSEAEWVLTEHPEWLTRIARSVLDIAPEVVIPMLLGEAVGDTRDLPSSPDHPLRQLGDWVTAAWPGSPAVEERRKQLMDATQQWWDGDGDDGVAVHALALALSPEFSRTDPEPGSGREFTFLQGFVSIEDVPALRSMWPSIREQLRETSPELWGPIRKMVWAWAFPGRVPHPMSDELVGEAKAFAQEMITDLVGAAKDHPGIGHWAQEIAKRSGLEVPVTPDPTFDILFPPRELGDWRKGQEVQQENAEELARKWAESDPEEVAPKLLHYERESQLTARPWPRWTPFVCQRIADQVADHQAWLEHLLDGGAKADMVQPFLRALLREDPPSGAELASRCVGQESQRLSTAITLLTLDPTKEELLETALAHLDGGEEWIKMLCSRSELSDTVLKRLLEHPDDPIACAAAVGEWHADPEGTVRESVQEEWESAILRCSADEWFLQDIFEAYPELGAEWLGKVLTEGSELWRHDQVIDAIIEVLGGEARRKLIKMIPSDFYPREIVQQLVDDDLELYRELLEDERLKRLHLSVLAGHPNPSIWADEAKLAMEAGYGVDEIVDAAFGHSWGWNGNESDMWEGWAESFRSLQSHEDERIRRIGERGEARAAEWRDEARKREWAEQVRGR